MCFTGLSQGYTHVPVYVSSVLHSQTSLRAATSRKICRSAPLCAKLAGIAVTSWPAASAALTRDSTTASARRAIMARVCSTSAQVGRANANGYVFVTKTLSTLAFASSAGSCRQLRLDNSCISVASHHILQLELNAPRPRRGFGVCFCFSNLCQH